MGHSILIPIPLPMVPLLIIRNKVYRLLIDFCFRTHSLRKTGHSWDQLASNPDGFHALPSHVASAYTHHFI